MSLSFDVGQTAELTIGFLNQNGQPMVTQPTPDAVPAWSNTTPATDTLTPAADGLSASDVAVAVGTDTVSVSLTVGGQPFAATLDVTVAAEPEVLTSIVITPGTPTGV